METLKPFNLMQWINAHQHELQPPVCNKIIYSNHEFIVMVVGGPNQRKDFHVNQTAEIFYQIKGEMLLKVFINNDVEEIFIKEGEIFQLPANIPHSPQRFADTIGIVIEQIRKGGQQDTLLWFCDNCNNEIYHEKFTLNNIETDFEPVFNRYQTHIQQHNCLSCGVAADASN